MDISIHEHEVITEYGIEGTLNPQISIYPYEANTLRTASQQAEAEAQSKYQKLIKYSGYRVSIDDIDTETYIKPMKAHEYGKQKHKLKWPCYVQPKLNGMRCLALRNADSVTLTTGLGNDITTMDHIKQGLMSLMEIGEVWDGELYCHGMPLPQILGIVKANKTMYSEDVRRHIEYHVFDRVAETTFEDRHNDLLDAVCTKHIDDLQYSEYIQLVETFLCLNTADAEEQYRRWISDGYEGIMYRNAAGLYTHKRSYDILKRKDFKEDDFRIVGYTEGKGGSEGLLVSLICLLPGVDINSYDIDKDTFDAPLGEGWNHTKMKELLDNPFMWEGKWLNVKFLEFSEHGVPQIPKGIVIRDGKGVD